MMCVCRCMQEAGSRAISGTELAVLEGQLTWLVHVIGTVVRGRQSSSAAESQACCTDRMEGAVSLPAANLSMSIVQLWSLCCAYALGEQRSPYLPLSNSHLQMEWRLNHVGHAAC